MSNITKLHFSAYKFRDLNSLGFSDKDYSKMKHGSKATSRKFGVDLANKFLCSSEFVGLVPFLTGKEIVICSAPWKSIGVASTHIKNYFVSRFNPIWSEVSPSLQDLKVYRGHSYNDDYGSMDKEARSQAINSDDFHIDKEFIKNKVLIFIDDVKITGSHEDRIQKLLENVGFEGTVIYLYYAEYLGDGNPDIENLLNYAFVKCLLDINYIIQNDEFIFNTRVVKYILKSNHEEFKSFINYQSKSFMFELTKELTGNEYHKIPEYRENYEYLKSKIQ